MNEVTQDVLKQLGDTFAPKSLTEEITALKTSLEKSATADDLQKLENILKTQGDKINELATPQTPQAEKSLHEQVEGIITENKDGYNDFINKVRPFKFDLALKTPGTMTIGGNITGSTTLLPTPQMLPGYNPYLWNPATFLDYANLGSTNSARISYVDEVDPAGTPVATAEGIAKPKIDVDLQVGVSDAVKIPATLKVSTEMLQDVSFVSTLITRNLVDRVRLASSLNIYNAIAGTSGIQTAVHSSLAGMGGAAANIWQLVIAANITLNKVNQVCTHIFLNPTDYARLLLLKSDDERGIVITATQASVNGIIIVPTNSINVDTYLAANYSKLQAYTYKTLSVEQGWENDDFTKNLRTFLAEWRFHRFIQPNDANAFLLGSVSTDLTTLSI